MKCSELIAELEKAISEHGDLEVYVQTFDGMYTDDEIISGVSLKDIDCGNKKMIHLDR